MADLHLDRAKTALLCLDMHNVIVERVPESRRETLVPAVRRVLEQQVCCSLRSNGRKGA